jgi:dTDP-4-amino-4,6-dideoxygalactose transaminase
MLAERLGRRHAVLVGHATTALWLLLEHVAGERGAGEVILPALLCPSVAQVVLYAGFRPRFADVRRDDFTLDPASVARLVGPETRVIVPVHLFGHSAEVRALKALAPQALVVEDAAQSLGAHAAGLPHGALADAAILSFGGTKVIDAGGGGALVTDDDRLAAFARRRLPELPVYRHDELLALSHRNLVHGLMDLVRAEPSARVGAAMRAVMGAYRPLYCHQFPPAAEERLTRALHTLNEELARRRARAEATHRALAPFSFLQRTRAWAESGVCWRYSFLADTPDRCLRLTAGLRKGGIHASNHYFSLARLFDDLDLPNAELVHRRIINLWVTEVATDAYLARTAQIIGDLTEKERS